MNFLFSVFIAFSSWAMFYFILFLIRGENRRNEIKRLKDNIDSSKYTRMFQAEGGADTVSATSTGDPQVENLTPTEKANRWLKSLN